MFHRQSRSVLILVCIILFPLMLRVLWLHSLPQPYLIPDEILYPEVGRAYVRAILSGGLYSFRINSEHPPLAKLLLGAFLLVKGDWPPDIDVLRILSAIFSSITCVIIWVHLRRYGKRIAFLGWLLASIDPLSIRYSVAFLDIAATMFLTASMCLALSEHPDSRSKNVLIGVSGGLAILCKYSALAVMAGAYILEHIVTSKARTVESLKVTLLSALIVVLVGNPLLWPPVILGYSGLEVLFFSSSVYSTGPGIVLVFDWLEPLLGSVNQGLAGFYLSMFLSHVSIFPFRLFSESLVPWLLLACLCRKLKKREPLSYRQRSQIPWLLSCILFFWLVEKSRIETYYMVMMGPSVTMFTTLMLPLPREEKSC